MKQFGPYKLSTYNIVDRVGLRLEVRNIKVVNLSPKPEKSERKVGRLLGNNRKVTSNREDGVGHDSFNFFYFKFSQLKKEQSSRPGFSFVSFFIIFKLP